MKKLILVRYGEWQNNHLSEEGIRMMSSTAERLKTALQGLTFCIISAEIPRAIESAEILAKFLTAPAVEKYPELYAAEEDGRLADPAAALNIITSVGQHYDVVVTVVSREYIETLPQFIFTYVFAGQKLPKAQLDRGEALIIDFETRAIRYLD